MPPLNKSFLFLPAFVFVLSFAECQVIVDGKTFSAYSRKHFRPHRGLFYQIYASPLLTVDPLALGGKTTYAAAVGARFNVWESRSPYQKLSGLRVHGFYFGGAYEFYPQQFDKLYSSFWLRFKSIMPITARVDFILAHGYGLVGFSRRYGFGFEVKNMTVLLCGEYQWGYYEGLGWHPVTESKYANQGSIHLIVPLIVRNQMKP